MAFGFDPRQRAGLSALGYKTPVNPWEKYGYRDEDVAGLLNTSEGDLPILEETTMVQPAPGVTGSGSTLGIRGGAGAGGEVGIPRFNTEVTVHPPEVPDFVNRLGERGPEILGGLLGGVPGAEAGKHLGIPGLGQRLEDLPDDEEALARLGRGTSEAYNFARQLHPMGELLPEHRIGPETQATLDRLDGEQPVPGRLGTMPAPAAPSGVGPQRPEIGLTPEQWMEKHAAAPYAKALETLGEGSHPGFDVGPPKGLADIVGREVGAAGLRTEDGGRTAGVTAFDTPGGGTTYRSTGDNSIFVRDAHGPAKADELAGLRSRAFNAPGGPDPQAEAMMRLSGVGGGGGHIMQGVAGPDVSQASLEHELQQRAAKAQLSDMESQARARAAEATAREQDPLGIERLKAQQALDAARFNYQNEGRRQVSLADDQFRAQQKADRDAEEQRIITDHLDTKRALQERLAQFPPNLPPGSPEAAQAAMLQRQLDSLNEETQLQLSRLGVRLPNTPY